MKYLTTAVIFILLANNAISQSWITSNSLMGQGDISDIQSTSDSVGSIITLGYFDQTVETSDGLVLESYGGRDYFVSKYNRDGEIEWLKQLGGDQNEFLYGGIATSSDGFIFVTGSFRNYLKYTESDSIQSKGADDIFLAKYNLDGDIIWCKTIGSGAKNQRSTSLKVDNNNDLILAGFFVDSIYFTESLTLYNDNNKVDYFYSKFDAEIGEPIWTKQIAGIDNNLSGRIFDIATNDNEYVFTGVFYDSIGFEDDTIISLESSQDVHLFKTDLSGNLDWIRVIAGKKIDYSFCVTLDNESNIYIGGYSDSDTISVESTENSFLTIAENRGGYDVFIAKYSGEGELQWINTNGGIGSDVVLDIELFESDNNIYVSGHFVDSMYWGGILLTTEGSGDVDMFIGSLNADGEYRSANGYAGRNNSYEESFSIFESNDELYSVIRSNSDLLVLGKDIYTNPSENHFLAYGVIGCNPISIDQVIPQNVQTCFGDSTGSLQILATGGFGAPWQYSIDNGLNYQDLAYFADLPAGDYPIVVIDAENCAQPGPTETVSQPDPLSIELISDNLIGDMIEIVVTAAGGSPPHTYTLQPDGIVQGFGAFNVEWNDTSKYFVEVNDLNGCGPVATDTLTTSSGIELSAPGVKLYPNPTSGVITLEMPFEGAEASLEVLSLTGQVLVSRRVYSAGGVINETVDLSNLSKGMYMIRVEGQTLRSGVVVN